MSRVTEGFVMPLVDCYAVLGVPRAANLCQVRRAYRTLCHQFDPDRDDETRPAVFRDVTEAFDTLRDAGARADHERELTHRDVAGRTAPRPRHLSAPRDLFDDFEDYRPSRDEILRVFVDNLLDRLPKSRAVRPVHVDVALDEIPTDAGGVVPLRVPAPSVCEACEGTGRAGFFACDSCGGEGVSWSTLRVDVPVPAGAIGGGTGIPVSLQPVGVTTLFLNVTVRAPAAPM
jgi:molecular chaperone DnaJ